MLCVLRSVTHNMNIFLFWGVRLQNVNSVGFGSNTLSVWGGEYISARMEAL